MKAKLVPFALLLAFAPALSAQENAPANPGRLQLAPAPTDTTNTTITSAPSTPSGTSVTNLPEVTLIPEQVPAGQKPAEAAPATPAADDKKSKTEESAEDLLLHIHFREARTKALRDPKVQAEWDKANAAKTDYDKRAFLKNYYTLLYARILQIDSSVKKISDLRRTTSLHRLEQSRIDPTIPLDSAQ